MKWLKRNKGIWVGGLIGLLCMLLGFIGSTPICGWNPVEGSVVSDTVFCKFLGIFYLLYFGVTLVWSLPYKAIFPQLLREPVDVTNWTAFDYVVSTFVYSIPTFIIGSIIGAFVGLVIQKSIAKLRMK
jgi:hypothetical protein